MRIAQISPLTEAVPPKLYGGTERVISWLTEELVALGHNVTLFASGDSQTSAQLKAIWPHTLRLDESICDPIGLHLTMLEQVRRQADEFDLMHFHLDYYPFSLFSSQPTPFVTTLHGRLDLPKLQPVFSTFAALPIVSISNSQRRPIPQANWVKTIYHGLPEHLLTPQPVKHSYLAFLGRISPEKSVDRAIHIAEHCGLPINSIGEWIGTDLNNPAPVTSPGEPSWPVLSALGNSELQGQLGRTAAVLLSINRSNTPDQRRQ